MLLLLLDDPCSHQITRDTAWNKHYQAVNMTYALPFRCDTLDGQLYFITILH